MIKFSSKLLQIRNFSKTFLKLNQPIPPNIDEEIKRAHLEVLIETKEFLKSYQSKLAAEEKHLLTTQTTNLWKTGINTICFFILLYIFSDYFKISESVKAENSSQKTTNPPSNPPSKKGFW